MQGGQKIRLIITLMLPLVTLNADSNKKYK